MSDRDYSARNQRKRRRKNACADLILFLLKWKEQTDKMWKQNCALRQAEPSDLRALRFADQRPEISGR
jgi:hypothetical protein